MFRFASVVGSDVHACMCAERLVDQPLEVVELVSRRPSWRSSGDASRQSEPLQAAASVR